MAIYFDNSNITTGSRGPEGPQGIQGPIGPNEVSATTTTNISGILKGNGSTVQTAIAGTDYATPDDAKAFVVTLTENTGDLKGTFTSDKTLAEIYAAYNVNKNIIGRFASNNDYVMRLLYVQNESFIQMGYLYSNGIVLLSSSSSNLWAMDTREFVIPSSISELLPESGSPLSPDIIYNVSAPLGTYAFTPPEIGWAHGTFTTGSSVSVSFSGTFIGAPPTIEASKIYEFDVFDGVWAVQEVVTA